MIGKTLGSYRIVGKLGEGGMGVVYTAEHPLIGRKAAVKRLLPEFCNNKEIVERFFNEARAAAMIKHAGIVDIFDFGYADDGSAYIVMEFLEGDGLTARLATTGMLADAELVRLGRQVASALAAAHEAGIVHRDLKPDNIHIVPDGEVQGGERIKVLDFGIAKLNQGGGTSKTRTGAMMGSPLYMAPEQCRGAGEVDARADVYSLGCVLFHMACGRPPFDGEGVGEVIAKHIYEPPPAPRTINHELAPELEAIILCCLAKEPDQRFESMNAVVAALDVGTHGRFATAGHQPRYRTPPVGTPIQPTLAATTAAPLLKRDTTLGSAAAQVTVPPVRPPAAASTGKRLWLVGVAVVVLGGGAVVALEGGGGDGAEPKAVAQSATGTGTGAGMAAAIDAGAAVPDAGAPVPPVPPVPTRVEVALSTNPSNANVYLPNGVRLGKTPIVKTFERMDGELVYTVRRRGYEDREVVIPLTADYKETIELEKVSRSRSARAKAAQPPAKVPATTTQTKPPETKPPVKKPPPPTSKPKWGDLED